MPTFQVPLSSSPGVPATAESAKQRHNFDETSFLASNLSTTPAGPPPSSNGSFTPAEPPPSSLLGSSSMNSRRNVFQVEPRPRFNMPSSVTSSMKSPAWDASIKHPAHDIFQTSTQDPHPFGDPVGIPLDSPSTRKSLGTRHSDNGNYERTDETSESREFGDSRYGSVLQNGRPRNVPNNRSLNSSAPSAAKLGFSSLSPRGTKRSRGGDRISTTSASRPTIDEASYDSAIPAIARNMAGQVGPADLSEDDDFISTVNGELNFLTASFKVAQDVDLESSLCDSSEKLRKYWTDFSSSQPLLASSHLGELFSVGPPGDAPPVLKAIFVATLALWIHHPPVVEGSSLTLSTAAPKASQAMPKILIDWSEQNHNPWQAIRKVVEEHKPSPCAHYNYWDLIFTLVLRGRLGDAVKFLREADFGSAETASRDGQPGGYTEDQLANIDKVVDDAVQVLIQAPSHVGDWDMTGNSWAIFRNIVRRAVDELVFFAEENGAEQAEGDAGSDASPSMLRSSMNGHFGITLPSTVFQSLKAMYGILLGGEAEIISSAQDWVEATIGMTVWWTGEDQAPVSVGDLVKTRRSLTEARAKRQRFVDQDYKAAYLTRLCHSFQRATNTNAEDDFQINTNNPVEVGLACVFESNFEGFLGLLRTWSLPISDAVAEIATMGGWFSVAAPVADTLMQSFDVSDLMVLSSYDEAKSPLRRDSIMVEYAHALFENDELAYRWRSSLDTLARIGDEKICRDEIVDVLSKVPIADRTEMDDILEICVAYGIPDTGYAIAEKFADSVVEGSQAYGIGLLYYARARSRKKLKNLVDLLLSMSLLRSVPYPPRSSLDPNLWALLNDPETFLGNLSTVDIDAANMLGSLLSGYAALRQFYDIRDQQYVEAHSQKGHIPVERRLRLALPSLLAVVRSGAQSIAGGVFDIDQEVNVPLDALLTLLGEALVYINGAHDDVLTEEQCLTLLEAIENLQAIGEQHFAKSEEYLQSTLAAYHGRNMNASPQRLLKTMSSMTSTSSFSLIGSSLLDSQSSASDLGRDIPPADQNRNENRRRQVSDRANEQQASEERGWDWRAGVPRESQGEDILRILRLGLAHRIAKHWVLGSNQGYIMSF